MGPRLTRLTLSNYRSFVDVSEVDFPLSGLVSLSGINKDTGGGSGSGKSNFITAIAYILGFSPLPYTDFQSWYSDKDPILHAEFETDQGTFSIIRGKHFRIYHGEEEFKGSAAQKEAEIDRVFGTGSEFRKMLTYRGQRQPGSFLSNTDSKKKEFLMQILGLDKFEEALDLSAKNIVDLQERLHSSKAKTEVFRATLAGFESSENLEKLLYESLGVESLISVQKAGLTNLKNKLAILHKDIQNETNAVLINNKILHKDALDKFQDLENEPFVTDVDRTEMNRLAKMVSSCKERIDALSDEDKSKRAVLNTELRKLQNAVDIENAKIAQTPGLEKQYQKLQLEINKLEAGKCSMCDRAWEEALVKREVLVKEQEELLNKLAEVPLLKTTIAQLQLQMEPFKNFEPNPKIAQMVQAKANLESQFAVEKQKIDTQKSVYLSEKNAKLAELKSTANAILADGEKQARLLRESRMPEAEAYGQQIQELTNTIAVEQDIYNDVQRRITRVQYAEEQRKAFQPKLEDEIDLGIAFEVDLKAEQDFLALIGREGFLGSVFDEILAEISDETNKMLAQVANTRHVVVEFKSETLTQKGTVSRSIVPMVTIGGNESSLKAGLSGGMLSVVELATDLAVGAVIATRTGTCPQFLVLDEVLDGLGVIEKETALELIQNYAQNRLVIMTDHSSETKALFQKQICIEYSNGRSIVV